MAQLTTDGGNSIARVKNENDGLTEMRDWLKAEQARDVRVEDEAEVEARAPIQTAINAKGTAIVTGRPTGNHEGSKAKKVREELFRPIEVDLGGKNWIGHLLEYRNVNRSGAGPDYEESSLGIERFTCSVRIGECPHAIGNPGAVFKKKKDAKQYAAMLAVEWLIKEKRMPPDGSVSFPKARPPPNNATAPEAGTSGGSISVRQQVVQMCMMLEMPPPIYVITPLEDFSAMYNGHAHFDGHQTIPGRVAYIENVHGKKNAKEACAEKLLTTLKEIVAKRHSLRRAQGGSGSSGGILGAGL